jgi:hypothetical protein
MTLDPSISCGTLWSNRLREANKGHRSHMYVHPDASLPDVGFGICSVRTPDALIIPVISTYAVLGSTVNVLVVDAVRKLPDQQMGGVTVLRQGVNGVPNPLMPLMCHLTYHRSFLMPGAAHIFFPASLHSFTRISCPMKGSSMADTSKISLESHSTPVSYVTRRAVRSEDIPIDSMPYLPR